MNAIKDISALRRAALNAEEGEVSSEQKELDRQRLRALVLEGMNSPIEHEVDDAFFARLLARIDPPRSA